ncbi:MASE4 domain-containing protein [Bradyrhizobium elkanii]
MKQAVIVEKEQRFTLAGPSPSRLQQRMAVAIIFALLAVLFLSAGELATIQLQRIDAFVPIYATVVFVNDLITAVLLFNQFSIERSRALLTISSGYFVTALMVIPWTLTFPGVFAPNGLLGAGLQSTNWLYVLRYGGFPTFVMAYALFRYADPPRPAWESSVSRTILSSVVISLIVVCAVTVFVTAGDAYLPRISIDSVHFSTLWLYLAGCLIAWNALALILLWSCQRSVLDLWLMVVVCAYAVEISYDYPHFLKCTEPKNLSRQNRL